MTEHSHLTLDVLARACGACPDELRVCGVVTTFQPCPQIPTTKASLSPSMPIPTSTPHPHAFPGAEHLDCDHILRISQVIIGKGPQSSLSHLQLPSLLQSLAKHSFCPETQAASALGEQILSETITSMFFEEDPDAPPLIVHAYRAILTSPWMLGAYGMHCGINIAQLVPPISRQTLIEENLRRPADAIAAMVGMAYIYHEKKLDVIRSWINEVVLPWSVEITPYLRRLSSSNAAVDSPTTSAGNRHRRDAPHVGTRSFLRNEWMSDDRVVYDFDESMLEAFVNVWALQQFDESLWMPALQTKFAEYIADLENPHESLIDVTHEYSRRKKRLREDDTILVPKRSPASSSAAPGVEVDHPPKRRRRYPPPPVISFTPAVAHMPPRPPVPTEPEDAGLSDLTNISVPSASQSQSWMQKQYNFLLNQYHGPSEELKSSKALSSAPASAIPSIIESLSSTPSVPLAPASIPQTSEDNSTLPNSSYSTVPSSIASTPASPSTSPQPIQLDSSSPPEPSSSSEQSSTHTRNISTNCCIASSSVSRHSAIVDSTSAFTVIDNEPHPFVPSAIRKPKALAVGTRRERHIRAGSSLLRAGASLLRVALSNHQSFRILNSRPSDGAPTTDFDRSAR